jgi:hypothetical protein
VRLHPLDGEQRLAGVAGGPGAADGELPQPGGAQPRHLQRSDDGDERLVRADVRAGLLAADVLLAGAQRRDVRPGALGVDRLTDEAPGQAAHEGGGGGEEAEVGPAQRERRPERLALPHHHVGAERPRGAQQPGGDRVEGDHQQGPVEVGHPPRLGQVLEHAEVVRLGDDERSGGRRPARPHPATPCDRR